MFGFLSPSRPPRAWRQSYARICQYQRRLFGGTSLLFLSYEAAFLYQLATDLELNVRLPEESVTCCRLRKLQGNYHLDRTLGEFSATFGLILAGVKLQDDLLDSNRWFNHLLWWKYRRQVTYAKNLLETGSPGLLSLLSSCIERHTKLEKQVPAPTLEELVVPTGDGFSAVFQAAGKLISPAEQDLSAPDLGEAFAAIGRHVGQAIIAWDCAVDFDYDRLQRQFTPLTSLGDVQSAFDMCQRELVRAAWLCPTGSVSQDVLNSVLQRVQARQAGPARICNPTLMERWGFLRQRGSAYARCDGCEALCLFAECASCLASVPGSDPGSNRVGPGCCEGATCLCPDRSCQPQSGSTKSSPFVPQSESTSTAAAPKPIYEQFVGRKAVTVGALSPVGFVKIDGNRIPARADSGEFIEQNTDVRILSADGFGVTVKRS